MSAEADVKITYATLTGDQLEVLHRGIDREVERVQERFGAVHPNWIGGQAVSSPEEFDDVSPHDTRISLGRFQQATPRQVRDAVAAAVDAFPTWASQPWRERVAAVRRLADAIR
ncbi:MAG: aldehyde dehydrogenase family protein, partial [Acidobacteria bacterium]|nr:aldehyde dehydrogenase family protein [Acidobacteriota bacterium]